MKVQRERKPRERRKSRRTGLTSGVAIATRFAEFNHHRLYRFETQPDGSVKTVCRSCGYSIQSTTIDGVVIMNGYALKFPCPNKTASQMLPLSDTSPADLSWEISDETIQETEEELEENETDFLQE